MALAHPLPQGMRIVRATAGTDGEPIYTVVMSVPEGVLSLFSEVLELAGRLSGSEKLGALLTAMCAECVSTWLPAAEARARRLNGGF